MSISICRLMLISAAALTLASCGGGGDDAAGPSRMVVTPAEKTWVGPKSLCLNGTFSIENAISTHVIVGGQEPYRIVSTSPSAIPLQTTVTGKNPTFDIVANGSCASDFGVTVVVLDYHSAAVNVGIKFSNYDDKPVTPTPAQ